MSATIYRLAEQQSSALTAAKLAVEASNELLRFALEGPAGDGFFGLFYEPAGLLAKALRLSCVLQESELADPAGDYGKRLNELAHACKAFRQDFGG